MAVNWQDEYKAKVRDVAQFLRDRKITFSFVKESEGTFGSAYRVTFTDAALAEYTFPFWTGSAVSYSDNDEFAANVLSCLFSDAASGNMTLDDWLSEFGYDAEPIRKYREYARAYGECRRVHRKLAALFRGNDYGTLESLTQDF